MNKLIMFMLGTTLGSLITWKVAETKYKQLADEEIESVREYYKNKNKNKDKKEDVKKEDVKKEEMKTVVHYIEKDELDNTQTEYKKQVRELGYDGEDAIYIEPGVDYIEPFVIAPEEYGEIEGYRTRSWTYYADFVLTDEVGNIISDPEVIIGDGLAHFGEYEDDAVCVRNENTECDYEILKHDKTFSEINGEGS